MVVTTADETGEALEEDKAVVVEDAAVVVVAVAKAMQDPSLAALLVATNTGHKQQFT